MRKITEAEPEYSVTQRVDVSLRADQVEHAIRCWLMERLHLPQPKSFSASLVRIFATDEGAALSASS